MKFSIKIYLIGLGYHIAFTLFVGFPIALLVRDHVFGLIASLILCMAFYWGVICRWTAKQQKIFDDKRNQFYK